VYGCGNTREEVKIMSNLTVPDICPKCQKPTRVEAHRAGDLPNRWVHTATGKVEC